MIPINPSKPDGVGEALSIQLSLVDAAPHSHTPSLGRLTFSRFTFYTKNPIQSMLNVSPSMLQSLLVAVFLTAMSLTVEGQVLGPPNFFGGDFPAPFSISAGDLDADGDADLIFRANDELGWFENINNGEYYDLRYLDEVVGQWYAWPVDLDNDGLTDILSSQFYSIVWYKNNGGGNFSEAQLIVDPTGGARELYYADMDGDGLMDVLISDFIDYKLYWVKNLGGGNFGGLQLIASTSPYRPNWILGVDLDGDGDNDLLSRQYTSSQRIIWYENLGGGAWGGATTVETGLSGSGNLVALDVGADGDIDILSTSATDNKVALYENFGGGSFSSQQVISTGQDGVNFATAGDLDGDGDEDVIAVSGDDEKVTSYINSGGTLSAFQNLDVDAINVTSAAIADLNGDGQMDAIANTRSPNELRGYRNLVGGVFDSTFLISTDLETTEETVVGDIDGDGDDDLLMFSGSLDELYWLENSEGRFTRKHFLVGLSTIGAAIALNDYDEDGDLDVVYERSSFGIINWLENDGTGNFAPPATLTGAGLQASNILFVDVDGDADEDLISFETTRLRLYKKTGPASVGSPQLITDILTVAGALETADIDNDGDMDLLASGTQNNRVISIINDGAGNFSFGQILTSTASGVVDLELCDVNLDGWIDVVAPVYSSDKLLYFENLGDGSFASSTILDNGLDGASEIIGHDFDNDGDCDLVVTAILDELVFYYENDGGTYLPATTLLSGKRITQLDLIDYDGDGDLDFTACGERNFTFENLSALNCSAALAPLNPSSSVSASSVTLSWDPVPTSLGCQLSGSRITPTPLSSSEYIFGTELSSFSFPIIDLLEGTSWAWKVRCACETTPVIIASQFSVEDTFAIPASISKQAALQSMAVAGIEIDYGPNPVTQDLHINFGEAAKEVSVGLFNTSGEELGRYKFEDGFSERHSISMDQLPSGSYLLVVTIGEASSTKLLIKE